MIPAPDLSSMTVVKVAGKNGIPQRIEEYTHLSQEIEAAVLGVEADPKTIAIVFDGDNYEPDRSPFSVLIDALAPKVAHVLAVKQKKIGYSQSFVNGWLDVPNLLFLQVDDDPNDWNTQRSHYVLNVDMALP